MGALLAAIRLYAPEIQLSVAFEFPRSEFARINNVDYYALGARCSREFSESVEKCIRTVDPDVIHVHGTENIAQFLPTSVFDRHPVISIQGIMEACAQNYLGGLAWDELKRFRNPFRQICRKPTLLQIASNWRDVRTPKERAICERIRFFMGRTDFDKTWVKGVNPGAHYFHVDEVLRPEFYRGQTWSKNIKNHVIYAGGAFAYPLKGGHWLVRALEVIKRRYPDVRLRVAASSSCVGGRWRDAIRLGEYQRFLVHLARQLKVDENIDFLPALSANQVRKELECATVYCLPSMMENSPNSLCEAQMVGTPVVATNVGGVPSFVSDQTGSLVPPGDFHALAQAIMFLFEHPVEQTQTRVEKAYAEAVRRHEPRRIVVQLVDAYRIMRIGMCDETEV